MPHFDVVWLASEYEGLPNVIMEAMAAGVPVVASDIPGNRDLIVPGETGFLVPLGNRAATLPHNNVPEDRVFRVSYRRLCVPEVAVLKEARRRGAVSICSA